MRKVLLVTKKQQEGHNGPFAPAPAALPISPQQLAAEELRNHTRSIISAASLLSAKPSSEYN